MPRYAGIKGNRLHTVSNGIFTSDNFNVLEVPSEFDDISAEDLIIHGRVKASTIQLNISKLQAKNIKVAFVTNYNMECGISTYAEFLFPQIAKNVGEFKLFIEHNSNPTKPLNQFGDTTLPDGYVVQCWNRGKQLDELILALKEYDPDIILINHEFGLFFNARYWISMMGQLSDYRVITIMHSVFPNHKDKVIVEGSMKEIVVHLDGAKNNLKNQKKISATVHVVPHGCYSLNKETLWNFYKSNHTFIQMGFLFHYKGWANSLHAVALLKDKYPDIFFTGVMSESRFAKVEHELYFTELQDLINKLGIQNNVGLIRGYQSEEVIDSYLRTNKVAVFPYVSSVEHEVFGASGAARLAMSKNIPVITSSVNHFTDLDTIKADTPEEIAAALDALFLDWQQVNAQLEKQEAFINKNSWEKVALKYIEIFETPIK